MPSLNIIISNQLSKVAAETTMDLQGLVSSMKDSGMTDKAIKDMLMNDLTSGGRVFGNFRNQVKNTVKSGVGISASNSSRASFESAGVKEYRWVAVGDKNVCIDCERRNGDIGSMEFWKTVGLPQSGFSICRYNCRCQLLPSDYAGEDLTEPILKSQPDLNIPANLNELGAALKVQPSTLENYSDIISNIVTDTKFNKKSKIKMLKSAFLGNKSLKKLGTSSRELIYRYTEKKYKPNNFKAKTIKEANEKNLSVNLTSQEKTAIEGYTGSQFEEINRYLRGLTDGAGPLDWEVRSQGLRTGLKKAVTWDATSWRGVKIRQAYKSAEFLDDWGNYSEGDTWMPKAFTSTSARKSVAVNWADFETSNISMRNALIEIEGKSGKFIDKFSTHSGEHEVLFVPNTRFKILKADVKFRKNINDSLEYDLKLNEFGDYYKKLNATEKKDLRYAISIKLKEID